MSQCPGLRFGYGTNGFANHTLPDAVAVLADLGYTGVALTLDHHHLNPFGPGLARRTAEVAGRLSTLGLAVVVETGARYLLDPWTKQHPTLVSDGWPQRVDLLRRAIRIAADLGAECVSFWSGVLPLEADPGLGRARLIDATAQVLEEAVARGVALGLEPEPGHVVERLDDALALRAALGSRRAGSARHPGRAGRDRVHRSGLGGAAPAQPRRAAGRSPGTGRTPPGPSCWVAGPGRRGDPQRSGSDPGPAGRRAARAVPLRRRCGATRGVAGAAQPRYRTGDRAGARVSTPSCAGWSPTTPRSSAPPGAWCPPTCTDCWEEPDADLRPAHPHDVAHHRRLCGHVRRRGRGLRPQLELALRHDLPVLVHTPHRDKAAGTRRSLNAFPYRGFHDAVVKWAVYRCAPRRPVRSRSPACVAEFAEPRYLHQVRELRPDGVVLTADDLPAGVLVRRGTWRDNLGLGYVTAMGTALTTVRPADWPRRAPAVDDRPVWAASAHLGGGLPREHSTERLPTAGCQPWRLPQPGRSFGRPSPELLRNF